MAWVTLLHMSQQLAPIAGTRSLSAVSISAANWRSNSVVGASTNKPSTHKPSTHKHFAFAATYAAYAKRGSWSSIG